MIQILGPRRWPTVRVLQDWASTLPLQTTSGDKRLLHVLWGGLASGVNPPTTLQLNASPRLNSIQQLEAFKAAGLQTISWSENFQDVRRLLQQGHLIFGRQLLHTQGTDIRIGLSGLPMTPKFLHSPWWSIWQPSLQEWRIHIWRGRVIARGLKIGAGGKEALTLSAASNIGTELLQLRRMAGSLKRTLVRSRRNGWTMVHNQDPPQSTRDAAIGAVKACGYDFGAVDVLVDMEGVVRVLEVNKAPALRSPYTLAAYQRAIVATAECLVRKRISD